MIKAENRIFHNLHSKKPLTFTQARRNGDWENTDNFIKNGRDWIIEQIKKSGLRGRGGAGFSTGSKWGFMPKTVTRPHYLVINADEGEPGTCKDRAIIKNEPHKLIEGCLIAGAAIGANTCYIYIRGEFAQEADILQNAINEAYKYKLLGKNAAQSGWDFNLYLHRGAGAYICGEESALLESLEGKKGFPRLKPPFPADKGLYGCPTTVNNVETIAVIPTILRRGAEWFNQIGLPNNTGTKLFCLSGNVNNPCVVEEEMGVKMFDLIENYGGGVVGGWENLQAIIPGGSSVPMLPPNICQEITMDFDSLAKVKSGLGTGGIIVIDKSIDLVKAIARLSKFYMHESCGQCSPCREGTGVLWRLMEKFTHRTAKKSDVALLEQITYQISGNTICGLGDAAAWPIQGLIRHFREELENRCVNN